MCTVPRTAAVPSRLCSVIFLLDSKPILVPFFDLIIRCVESLDFGPKSDDLGYRMLRSYFIPPDFAKSDRMSRPILFSDRKIKIRSSESDRITISLKNQPEQFKMLSFFLAGFTEKPTEKLFSHQLVKVFGFGFTFLSV